MIFRIVKNNKMIMFNNIKLIVSSLFYSSGLLSLYLINPEEHIFSVWLYTYLITGYWLYEMFETATNYLFATKDEQRVKRKYSDSISIRAGMVLFSLLMSILMNTGFYSSEATIYKNLTFSFIFVRDYCFLHIFIAKAVFITFCILYTSTLLMLRWYKDDPKVESLFKKDN